MSAFGPKPPQALLGILFGPRLGTRSCLRLSAAVAVSASMRPITCWARRCPVQHVISPLPFPRRRPQRADSRPPHRRPLNRLRLPRLSPPQLRLGWRSPVAVAGRSARPNRCAAGPPSVPPAAARSRFRPPSRLKSISSASTHSRQPTRSPPNPPQQPRLIRWPAAIRFSLPHMAAQPLNRRLAKPTGS